MSKKRNLSEPAGDAHPGYEQILNGVVNLLEQARRASARAVNVFITATYWEIGRRIVEFDQGGKDRSSYGEGLLPRLAVDLTARFGRGFSLTNLKQFRKFYLLFRGIKKSQTVSDLFAATEPSAIAQTASELTSPPPKTSTPLAELATLFPLPWSHYVLLLKVDKPEARKFYEAEAHRNGWTVRQLERQITTLYYERTLASRDKGAMLKKGAARKPGEALTPEEHRKRRSRIPSSWNSWGSRMSIPRATWKKP